MIEVGATVPSSAGPASRSTGPIPRPPASRALAVRRAGTTGRCRPCRPAGPVSAPDQQTGGTAGRLCQVAPACLNSFASRVRSVEKRSCKARTRALRLETFERHHAPPRPWESVMFRRPAARLPVEKVTVIEVGPAGSRFSHHCPNYSAACFSSARSSESRDNRPGSTLWAGRAGESRTGPADPCCRLALPPFPRRARS